MTDSVETIMKNIVASIDNSIADALYGGTETTTAAAEVPTLTIRSLLKMSLSLFTGLDVKITDDFPNDQFAYVMDPKKILPFPGLDPDAKEVLIISEENALKLQSEFLRERHDDT